MQLSKFIKIGAVAYLFIAPIFIFAQATEISKTVEMSMSPQNPSPGETVTFGISAYEFNVDLSNVVWSVDGKVVKSGVGIKSFSLTAPANGKSSVVSVSITPKNEAPITRSITISPSDIDLIYEVLDGHVPTFYRGKVLPIKQSQIKIVALPNVKTVSGGQARAKDFAYTWRKDGENAPSQSGFGRNSLIFSNQILDTGNTVEVSATNGLKTVVGTIDITLFEPEIVFYELDLVSGIKYQRAFKSGEYIKQSKLSLIAEPYFLSKGFMTNNDIKTSWYVNGQLATSVAKNNVILNTATTAGRVDVSFEYNDTKKLFRNLKKAFNLNISN